MFIAYGEPWFVIGALILFLLLSSVGINNIGLSGRMNRFVFWFAVIPCLLLIAFILIFSLTSN